MMFHHIGIVTKDIESSSAGYRLVFGNSAVSPPVMVKSQDAQVCFVDVGGGPALELVMPCSPQSPLYNLIKKGIACYHISFLVESLDDEILRLEEAGYKTMHAPFRSEAFDGSRCIFLINQDMLLVELIESGNKT